MHRSRRNQWPARTIWVLLLTARWGHAQYRPPLFERTPAELKACTPKLKGKDLGLRTLGQACVDLPSGERFFLGILKRAKKIVFHAQVFRGRNFGNSFRTHRAQVSEKNFELQDENQSVEISPVKGGRFYLGTLVDCFGEDIQDCEAYGIVYYVTPEGSPVPLWKGKVGSGSDRFGLCAWGETANFTVETSRRPWTLVITREEYYREGPGLVPAPKGEDFDEEFVKDCRSSATTKPPRVVRIPLRPVPIEGDVRK